MKYKKVAQFGDIHFGKRQCSEVHNQDCINYIKWFCEQVKKDPNIDCIFFLGDWHDHRSSIGTLTLHYSNMGATMLNELGLDLYFITGNHELQQRNSRDIYSTVIFKSLTNFTVINEPLVLEDNNCVLAPYLFNEEYPDFFRKYSKYDIFAGHFNFNGFRLSGEYNLNEHGVDPKEYKKPKHIFSGHLHMRDSKNNIHYIGNTFPMDFSDVNDNNRGMATYDFEKDEIKYINWLDCPKYIKTKLSDLLKNSKNILTKGARVRVLVDEVITLTENNELRKQFTEKYELREIGFDEQPDTVQELTEIEQEVEDLKLDDVNEIIPELLKRIKSNKINPDILVKLYREL